MSNPAENAHLNEDKDIDFTKTKLYASIDLVGKSISAIALIILGIAGFLLQRGTEMSREAAETREQQERQYLPMLRSLSLLEIELEDVSQELAHSKNAGEVRWIATNLRFVASSVFVPDEDPKVSILPPDQPLASNIRIQMRLRATALMYADALKVKANFHDTPPDLSWRLDIANATLVNTDGGRQHLMPDSVPAWQTWLGNRPVSNSTFRFPLIGINLQDLSYATSGVIQDELRKHPGLGDRYVQLREELEKTRRPADRISTDLASGLRGVR